MNNYRTIIIGGGPAGLCAATSAARALDNAKGKVLLLESSPETGRKLLISGSGQCNYTNNLPVEDFLKRLGQYAMYLKPAFYGFNNIALAQHLRDVGCYSTTREDGKVFPQTLQADDIRIALMKQLYLAGAVILTNAKVEAITKLPEGNFRIDIEEKQYMICDKVILATGGASYPQTGSDGKAVMLAKALGHNPVAFRPHLSSVSLMDFAGYSKCAGISIPDLTARFIGKERSFRATGSLLITHTGFSGPLILDNSHRLEKGDTISVAWVPGADAMIKVLKEQPASMSILNTLWRAPIPKNLLRAILAENKIPLMQSMAVLTRKDLNTLASILMDCRFTIKNISGLSTAMASAGGIPLSEINAKTMESRLCPGLFFAGEIMDYALPSGGFNIQIACSTGWLAGKNLH